MLRRGVMKEARLHRREAAQPISGVRHPEGIPIPLLREAQAPVQAGLLPIQHQVAVPLPADLTVAAAVAAAAVQAPVVQAAAPVAAADSSWFF